MAAIAATSARVPRDTMPVSARRRGPRVDSTASARATAERSAASSGADRSMVTAGTGALSPLLSRTTAVTS